MKAIEQYFHVSATVYYAVQDVSSFCVTIQMNATEQYFHVVLFVMLYNVVLT